MSRVRFDQPGVRQFLNDCDDRFRQRFCSVMEQIAQKLDQRTFEEMFLAANRSDALTLVDPDDEGQIFAVFKSATASTRDVEFRLPAWGLLVDLLPAESPGEPWVLAEVSGELADGA
jgi:hypothetical protein